jgi:toxin-antitoxin system PIN domain toxin
MPALLDVSVLIALMDQAHGFHHAAHAWFEENRQFGWATCPITENGCLRILSNPGYPLSGLTLPKVRDILAEFVAAGDHRFWPDSVSVLEGNRFELTKAGPKNLTDLYLLRLASACGGRLITFDRGIRWQSVTGCEPEHLKIV